MKLNAFQVHRSWLVRAALVLVATGLAEAISAWFTHRPILWAAGIASTLPISMVLFVLLPILRQENRKA